LGNSQQKIIKKINKLKNGKINFCVVTGSRAEYGLLYWLLRNIKKEEKYNLQLVVTGGHLSRQHGLTYKIIEKDNFKIDYKVYLPLKSDSKFSVAKNTGIAMQGFAEAYQKLNPGLVLVLGDRYEIFSAASSAMLMNLPIIHLHGGEKTLGAFDDALRHSITKMSYLHFTANEEYRKRVIQLGENPDRVFNVGALGIDSIKKIDLLSKDQLIKNHKIKLLKKNILVTFHPVTLDSISSKKYFEEILNSLKKLNDTMIIFTAPNADPDNIIIRKMINSFIKESPDSSVFYETMGQKKYLSTMQYVDAVLGNSSSGIIEAPSFNIGTINIGDRQQGRIKAKSVIDCDPCEQSIDDAIKLLYAKNFQEKLKNIKNPYGDGNTSNRILEIINKLHLPNQFKKEFYDL
tara:strand:- start:8510 stop:9718 length:1209 start_codon:yes stop_codon:yes gene_type:complete